MGVSTIQVIIEPKAIKYDLTIIQAATYLAVETNFNGYLVVEGVDGSRKVYTVTEFNLAVIGSSFKPGDLVMLYPEV